MLADDSLDVRVTWQTVPDDTDPRAGWSRVLYAYLHPKTRKILYIGKAWGCTVKTRWNAPDKKVLKRYLSRLKLRGVIVIVGTVSLYSPYRISHRLLGVIESLLISRIRPPGNISCIRSRNISLPGLVVRCGGVAWPGRSQYTDN